MSTGSSEHETRAADEWEKEFPDARVETRGRLLQDGVAGVERKLAAHPHQVVDHRSVRDHHALGATGGAGGVDDVGEVVAFRLIRLDFRCGDDDGVPLGVE